MDDDDTEIRHATPEAETLPDTEILPSGGEESAGLENHHGSGGHPSAEQPLSWLGRYRLLDKLGEGGFGTVWRAEQHEPIHRQVALKVIKPGMDSLEIIARFAAERQALAMMDHPNIAAVLDAGELENGRPYFVMELVRGETITSFCDKRQLHVRQRLELFMSVCLAIHHAHQKGILHRDLKPSNILVEEVDGAAVPKVIDFGIAKALGAGIAPQFDATLARTLEGMVIGTPQYMSPEQAGCQPDVDTRSDIYTLGTILYELLTGRPPLTPELLRKAALEEVLRLVREQEAPQPSSRLTPASGAIPTLASRYGTTSRKLTDTIKGELDWIVLKTLEKDRDRRYASAAALAEDLRRFLEDEPVAAGPPSRRYRLKKFLRRNHGAVTAAAVVLVTLIAGAGVSTWQAVRASRAEGAALKDADRARRSETAARRLIDSMLYDLKGQLQPLGKVGLLDSVVREAEYYYRNLPPEDLTGNVLRDKSGMLLNRGDVWEAQGKLTEAGKAFSEALAIIAPLARQEPGNASWQIHLGAVHQRLAAIALSEHRYEDARAAVQAAIGVAEQLAKIQPANVQGQQALAAYYELLGDVENASEQFPAARGAFEKSLEIRQDLHRRSPEDPKNREHLAISYDRLGDIRKRSMDLEGARQAYGESLALRRRLVADHPDHAVWQRSLSVVYDALGAVAEAQGRKDEAREAFDASLAMAEKLARQDEGNAVCQRDLSISLERIAHLEGKARNYPAARALFERSAGIGERLVRLDPLSPARQRDLSATYNFLEGIARAEGNPVLAAEYRNKWFGILEHMKSQGMELDPETARFHQKEKILRLFRR